MQQPMKTNNLLERRFFLAWLLGAIVMYLASYAWHGVFLNDFARLTYPKDILLMSFALIYLITALVVVLMVKFVPFKITHFKKGVLFGCGAGFFLYLVAFSFGITFYASPAIEHILFDLAWQTIEGGMGGATIGGTYAVVGRVMRFS